MTHHECLRETKEQNLVPRSNYSCGPRSDVIWTNFTNTLKLQRGLRSLVLATSLSNVVRHSLPDFRQRTTTTHPCTHQNERRGQHVSHTHIHILSAIPSRQNGQAENSRPISYELASQTRNQPSLPTPGIMVRPDKAHTCDYFHEPALGRASHHPTTSIPPHPSAFRNVSPFGPDPMAWEPSTMIQSHISYVSSTSLRTPYSSSSSYYSQELCPQLQATKHRYGTLDLCQRFLGCQREAGNGNSEHLMHGRHVTYTSPRDCPP